MDDTTDSTSDRESALRIAVEQCCQAGEAYCAQNADLLQQSSDQISQSLAAGNLDMWESLYGCVITGVPGCDHLVGLYVASATNPLFLRRIPDICRLARQGNKQALAVVGALLADAPGSEDLPGAGLYQSGNRNVDDGFSADDQLANLEQVVFDAVQSKCSLPSITDMPAGPPDEIERALKTYVNLPALIDVQLRPEGLTLDTDDFPKLIKESSGLDLQKYFIDAFKDADFLTVAEKEKFAADLFGIFETVNAFSSNADGATMHRTQVTEVAVPEAFSQGWVKKMIIDTNVTFALESTPPYEATFANVTGITFQVGGKVLALCNLNLKARHGKCVITPTLHRKAHLPQTGGTAELLKNTVKDLVVGLLMKMGKISTALPVVMKEFQQYLADVMRFKALLHDHDKDLVAFFERTANITVDDPITRSLLTGGMRLIKNNDVIEIERVQPSRCDLGGVALDIAGAVKLKLAQVAHEMRISEVCGIGIEIPFDSPAELRAIGLDLKRSLPNKIISLCLSGPDSDERRRLVAGTAPGCWVGVDLGQNMQPSLDADRNWMVFGVTNNPISGARQKFFVRLDEANGLKMTPQEIGDLVTQTAIEGFDPADPATWKWGAVAIGGQTLARAGSVTGRQARNLGRLIGWLLKPVGEES